MKKFALYSMFALGLAILGCNGDPESPDTTSDIESKPEKTTSKKGKSASEKPEEIEAVESLNENELTQIMKDFQNCVEAKSSPECKSFIAQAFCKSYKIDVFKNDEGYMDYDQILPYVQKSSNWKDLGDAGDRGSLDKAIELVSSGQPVLAINTHKDLNVVAFLRDETSVSKSWGGKVPHAVFYFPNQPMKSFTNKGLNYAFTSPGEVKLYALN